MNDFLGSVLILSAVLLLCYYPVYWKKQRIRLLFSLIQTLECMNQELRTNLSSITDLLEVLCSQSEQSIHAMIRKVAEDVCTYGAAVFKDSWRCQLQKYGKLLQWYEIAQLCNVGDVLGRYILEEQVSVISRAIQILETSYESELTQCRALESFRLRLGVMIGAGIIIVLI